MNVLIKTVHGGSTHRKSATIEKTAWPPHADDRPVVQLPHVRVDPETVIQSGISHTQNQILYKIACMWF